MTIEIGLLDDIYGQVVRSPTAIINGYSSGGNKCNFGVALPSLLGLASKTPASALVANTLTQVYSVTGSGEITGLVVMMATSTARTMRIKVTRDGSVVIFDATSSAASAFGDGMIVIGSKSGNDFAQGAPVFFGTSLKIEIASSINELTPTTVAAGIALRLF